LHTFAKLQIAKLSDEESRIRDLFSKQLNNLMRTSVKVIIKRHKTRAILDFYENESPRSGVHDDTDF
jgi:hypothetical protein